ncbi:MAG: asparagine synthase-related protein [Pseudomonadota bacterium]
MTGFAGYRIRPGRVCSRVDRSALDRGLAGLSRRPDERIGTTEIAGGRLATYRRPGAATGPAYTRIATLRAERGTFAAIEQRPDGDIHIATDRFGVRPVFHYTDDDLSAFATSLRVLTAMIAPRRRADPDAIATYVLLGEFLGTDTGWAGVRRLRGGERLTVGEQGTRTDIWYERQDGPRLSEPDALAAVERTILAAVEACLGDETRVHAALSGGMDSRLVCAALRRLGADVDSLCIAPDGSADAVLSLAAADALGTRHRLYRTDPLPFLRDVPFSALVAAQLPTGAGTMWTGDGGSVMLGHTYLTAAAVAAAAAPAEDSARTLMAPHRARPPALVDTARLEAVEARLAAEHHDADALAPDKRLLHRYMRGDQARHADRYFEHIDLFGAVPVMPIFDAEVADAVYAAPTDALLSHRLYNRLLARIHPQAGRVPWQPYPGHEPGPLPLPASLVTQWEFDARPDADARAARRAAVAALRRQETGLDGLGRIAAILATPLWRRAWQAERLLKLAQAMTLMPMPGTRAVLPPETPISTN